MENGVVEAWDQSGCGIVAISPTKKRAVPFVIPGEEVEILAYSKKEGRLLNVLKSSPQRITPKCAHFGECGGCKFQHVAYKDELLFKQQKVAALFFGHEVLPIIGASDIWGARNKMEFTFSQDRMGQKFLGLFMACGRGKVFNLKECPLSPDWYSETLTRVYAWWKETSLAAYNPHSDEGTLRLLTIRQSQESSRKLIMLTVSGRPEYAIPQEHIRSFVKEFSADNCSIFLRIHQAQKGMTTQFYEMHLSGPDGLEEILAFERPLHFAISPASFFQPHTKQAEKLYGIARDWIAPLKDKVVYDLFSGTATLSQVIADAGAKEVIAIEISPEAVVDAKVNVQKNGLANKVRLLEGDVFKILSAQKESLPRADVIILDPPRSGLGEKAAAFIADLKAETVLYISCNPITQAKEIPLFLKAGYQIEKIQPLDQFPRTPHVEIILLMRYSPFLGALNVSSY